VKIRIIRGKKFKISKSKQRYKIFNFSIDWFLATQKSDYEKTSTPNMVNMNQPSPTFETWHEAEILLLNRSLKKALKITELGLQSAFSAAEKAIGLLLKGSILHVAGRYQGNRALLDEALTHLQEALLLDATNTDLCHRVRLEQGYTLLYMRDEDAAFAEFEALFQETTSKKVISFRALIGMSYVWESKNDLQKALQTVRDAGELLKARPEWSSDANLLELYRQLAHLYLKRQEYAKIAEYSEPMLEISRRLGAMEYEVTALCNLAIVHSFNSEYLPSMQFFLESDEKSRRIGFRYNSANCTINIGTIYAQLYNYEQALEKYRMVLTDYRDILSDSRLMAINNNIGNIYFMMEDLPLSLAYFEECLRLAQVAGNRQMTAYALAQMGRNYLAMGDADRAFDTGKKSADLMNELGRMVNGKQINLLNSAHLQLLFENTSGAYRFAVQGIAVARRMRDVISELRGLKLLSDILKKEKDYRRALRCQAISSQLRDEIAKTQRNRQMIDLEIKYSLRDKRRRIEELTKENRYQGQLLEQSKQIAKQNEELRQANEELRQFAYITSHDLKEPLRMIGSFTQIIHNRFKANMDENNKIYFQYINEGVTRMNSLLDALLQYATIGKADLERETVSLDNAVELACQNLHVKIHETEAHVEFEDLPTLLSVPSLLIQLFQNLIGNAIKFRREAFAPVVLITAEMQGEEHLIKVHDNGIGIEPEHRERIFIIFQRLHTRQKYEGTGIGLAICQKIVQRLGGRIWVESETGYGSTFCFTLPK
jgi:signal transduction histidine kinase